MVPGILRPLNPHHARGPSCWIRPARAGSRHWEPSIGSDGRARYVTARYFDKWSDVDGWPELRDLVPAVEADKIEASFRGSLDSGRQYVLRRRPELTYTPTP